MNYGKIDHPTIKEHGVNESCGDEMDLYLKIENDKIKDAKFEAVACSVSVVSSAILTEEIVGKSLTEIESLDKEKLLSLIGVNLTTSRVKCATLPLDTLKKALEKYDR